ncbi:hypothetical protein AQUCO_03300028v1 [Aquilegia coerulea]|uniref:SWIM-type domain-containing protein n=1 Tax=Aquilegia coerulea TaxID=218851 RepID=A0A2G5CZ56_AQUCA|nr:hypothetical protein AQUCO_03300028v1 [Aquilegia coerulea]
MHQYAKRLGTSEFCITNKRTKATIGETSSAALLLNFASGVALPTKEDLITQFGRFGDLNELETDVMKDSNCARIVYKSKSNAEEAYNSSQKVSPLGAAVVSYELQYSTADSKASMANSQQSVPSLLGGNVVIPLSAVPPISEAPPLEVVRKNLESMTSMLEKLGDTLSPEVKANLESEIKRLLNKFNSPVTTWCQEQIVHNATVARKCTLERASAGLKRSCVVDLNKRTCTCKWFQTMGIPCEHAMAAIKEVGFDPYKFVEVYYLKETYIETYREEWTPTRGNEEWPTDRQRRRILPPLKTSKAGRHKTARKRGFLHRLSTMHFGDVLYVVTT